MLEDMYFLPILMRALDATCPRESLRDAFRVIETMGRDPEFEQGYRQFLKFLGCAIAHSCRSEEASRELESTDITNLAVARETVVSALSKVSLLQGVVFVLRRNGETIGSFVADPTKPVWSHEGITPGAFELCLESGRIIWEGELTKQEVLSAFAFPEEALRMAADTGAGQEKPTHQAVLFDGELQVRVYPGRLSGRLEVRLCQD